MLRITGIGASHFLLENLCYSNSFYSKFVSQDEKKSTEFLASNLKRFQDLREKLQTKLSELSTKQSPSGFKQILKLLTELNIEEEHEVD